MMTRAEHVRWCKERARVYVDQGDLTQAVASMGSDLKKHPETAINAQGPLMMLGMMYVSEGDAAGVRRWIEGFSE